MKKEILFGLIGSIALLILTGYYAGKYSGSLNSTSSNNSSSFSSTNSSTNSITNSGDSITLTASEIAKHASRSDCWIIVNGNVYGVAGYLNAHPGGAAIIIPYCGRDATLAYDTKGGRGIGHSGSANIDLSQLLIGPLSATVSPQKIQSIDNQVNNFIGGGEDD
jgi:cytochrome b involved in lipid metabolism